MLKGSQVGSVLHLRKISAIFIMHFPISVGLAAIIQIILFHSLNFPAQRYLVVKRKFYGKPEAGMNIFL